MVEAAVGLGEWRDQVAWQARAALAGRRLRGAVAVRVTFRMPRPKSHYRRDGSLRDDAPYWHSVRPDGDKLGRAVNDALVAGGVFGDDGQVAMLVVRKIWDPGSGAGAEVQVRMLEPEAIGFTDGLVRRT
jgi:crossover junction endodeoxyribonuclease RusA